MLLMETIIFFVLLIGFAYFRTPLKIWAWILALMLTVYSLFSHLPFWVVGILWLFLGLAVLIFSISKLRCRYITSHILTFFQKSLPPMSETEREALEAGNVYWEKELFCGRPDWHKLPVTPQSVLTAEETAFLDHQVNILCAMLDDWDIVHNQHDLPPAVWDYLKKEGFFGLQIAKEYGGHGFSVWAHSHIISKIASRSVSAGVTVMVPNSLGPAEFLQHFGTLAQKQYYLPRLARGEEIPAFALTGLEAGSDATAITDTGIVCRGIFADAEVIGVCLNWDKRYTTLSPIATLLGLAFKMYDPEHLLAEEENIGITLCLLPTNLPGIEIGQRHFPSGLGFLNGPTRGNNVFIPLDFIIGGVKMRGKGWQIMMNALAEGRGISLPALSSAGSKLCYRMTGAYTRIRQQFHLPIGYLEGVAEALGRIGGLTYLSEATRHFTIGAIAQGIKPSLGAAITKYHLTEMGRVVANDAMDIHAGHAIQLGPHNYMGFLYQSLPVGITVEGANILTRSLIIFGQGAMRCHPYLHEEIAATQIADPKQRLACFDQLFCQHLSYAVNHLARVFVYGLTGGRWISTPKDMLLGKYYKQLTRMSAALALITDLSFARFGSQLKRKETMSARLADILSQLYLASAVINYYLNHDKPTEDQIFVRWALDTCLAHIQAAFDGLFDNFAPRWLGFIMRGLIFPWGRAYRKPQDTLTREIARQMMKTSPQRDRLTQYCYIGKHENDATGRVELCLEALEKTQGLFKKWRELVDAGKVPRENSFREDSFKEQLKLMKEADIFSKKELKSLEDFSHLRLAALEVDKFSADFFNHIAKK